RAGRLRAAAAEEERDAAGDANLSDVDVRHGGIAGQAGVGQVERDLVVADRQAEVALTGRVERRSLLEAVQVCGELGALISLALVVTGRREGDRRGSESDEYDECERETKQPAAHRFLLWSRYASSEPLDSTVPRETRIFGVLDAAARRLLSPSH